MTVKVGPVLSEFAGRATFVERDEETHKAVINARGRDKRGSGNASATITAQLHPEGAQTRVSVDTDVKIVGKLAQFGSSMITQVSEKLMGSLRNPWKKNLPDRQRLQKQKLRKRWSLNLGQSNPSTLSNSPAGLSRNVPCHYLLRWPRRSSCSYCCVAEADDSQCERHIIARCGCCSLRHRLGRGLASARCWSLGRRGRQLQ